jgi:uncharacterized protein YukE
MPDLGAYDEPVRVDWDAARELAGEFRGTATVLEDQERRRREIAGSAAREWRGKYAEQFDDRVGICGQDASRFAGALRTAATLVEKLLEDATAEQDRRNRAQEWKRRQDQESLWNAYVLDPLRGEDDPPPPPPHRPPQLPVEAPPMPAERGPGVRR